MYALRFADTKEQKDGVMASPSLESVREAGVNWLRITYITYIS